MRTLGLDVGERRIGIAVSDPEARIALPVGAHERRGGDDASALLALARREDAGRIVVGLPLSLDGTHGPQAEVASQFAERLRAGGEVEIVLWDERLSSREADHHLRAAGQRGKRGKEAKAQRDAIAASIILQSYLDSRRDGALPPLPPIE
jgi:putative holliday junction resolvase